VAVSNLGDSAVPLVHGPLAVGSNYGLQGAMQLTVHVMPQDSISGPCSRGREVNVLREDAAIELQDCE
jgi:hypothetical protein